MTKRPQGKSLFKIALISDTHINAEDNSSSSPYPANREANDRAKHVFNQVSFSDFAFAVHMGDMVNPVPELPTYGRSVKKFNEISSVVKVPLHLVPGNHDIGDKNVDWMPAGMTSDETMNLYTEHFRQKSFYSFDFAGIHFVVLNTSLINSGLEDENRQMSWLEADLSENFGKRLFMFLHYPIYISEPAEPSSYDNIEEPGRGSLLLLLRKYRPEAVFSAHAHNFWYDVYNETEIYVLLSTCFVRHDYSEMYRIDGGDQFGRNDVAKLGFATLEIHEKGHVVHYHRSYGRGSEDLPQGQFWSYPKTHTKTHRARHLTIDMRHPWAETLQIAPSGAVDEFRRKVARNDYPLMALWEMGLQRMRVPFQDVDDPAVRQRMRLMRSVGHSFHVYVYDIPSADRMDVLVENADLVEYLEVVIDWDRREQLLPQLNNIRKQLGKPIFLSRVNRNDPGKSTGSQFNHFISHGFQMYEIGELIECRDFLLSNIDGLIFTIPRSEDAHSAVNKLDCFTQDTKLGALLYTKSSNSNPWESHQDDRQNTARIASLVFAAATARTTEVVLDTFADADRGYFVRNGLVDRRYNPRPAGRLLQVLVEQMDGEDWSIHPTLFGLQATDGTSLVFSEQLGQGLSEVVRGKNIQWWDLENSTSSQDIDEKNEQTGSFLVKISI